MATYLVVEFVVVRWFVVGWLDVTILVVYPTHLFYCRMPHYRCCSIVVILVVVTLFCSYLFGTVVVPVRWFRCYVALVGCCYVVGAFVVDLVVVWFAYTLLRCLLLFCGYVVVGYHVVVILLLRCWFGCSVSSVVDSVVGSLVVVVDLFPFYLTFYPWDLFGCSRCAFLVRVPYTFIALTTLTTIYYRKHCDLFFLLLLF